jgi:hypothetical protein
MPETDVLEIREGFSDRLRSAMQANGLEPTAAALARRVPELSLEDAEALLSGRFARGSRLVIMAAVALNFSPRWMVECADQPALPTVLSPDEQWFIARLRTLSDADRNSVSALLMALLQP